MGKQWKQCQTLFWVIEAMKLRRLLLGRKVMTNLDNMLKSKDKGPCNKGPSSQGFGFSSGHVWM